jgi:hypothetical protein
MNFRKYNSRKKTNPTQSLINFDDFVKFRCEKEKIITVLELLHRTLFKKTGRKPSYCSKFYSSTSHKKRIIPQQIFMTVDNLIISIGQEGIKNRTQFGKIMRNISGRRCRKWQKE